MRSSERRKIGNSAENIETNKTGKSLFGMSSE